MPNRAASRGAAATPGADAPSEHEADFETVVMELSARFVSVPAEGVDDEIFSAQRRICDSLGLDLCSVWQGTFEAPGLVRLTHLYRPLGGPPVPDGMDAREHFPWSLQQVLAGDVVAVSSMDDVPAEASRDVETWRHFGIRTALNIPLAAGGGPSLGAVSFNSMRKEHPWPARIVSRLRLVAQIIASALARKRAEQALRSSERQLKLAMESAEVVLWTLDPAEGHLWIGPVPPESRSSPIEGDSDAERLLDRVHPEDRDSVRAAVQQAMRSDEPLVLEYRVVAPDGSVRWMAARGRRQAGGAKGPGLLLGAVVDITESRKADEELQRLRLQLWHADRVAQTGALTASLAHELNQPLAAILSNAQAGLRFMSRPDFDADEIRAILRDIVADDNRAATVISGLRAMLRRKQTPREDIDMAATIQEVLRLLHSELLGRNLEPSLHLVSGCFVHADRAQLQQVILNLLMNAVETMQEVPSPNNRLTVSLARTPEQAALVSVRDTGAGIPVDQRGRMFEAFWTTKSDGMGIGLPISRSIIESHGGRLWFESNPDRGITFYFSIPLAQSRIR